MPPGRNASRTEHPADAQKLAGRRCCPNLPNSPERPVRKLDDLTLGPILTWSNQRIREHLEAVAGHPRRQAAVWRPGADRPFDIPECYGAIRGNGGTRYRCRCTGRGAFRPGNNRTVWPLPDHCRIRRRRRSTRCSAVLERMTHHLTAAVVSADVHFQQRVLGATVNGTTYCGMRARTTGAPQNHWFGPCGDPRAAGIGTPEAIVSTWSGHREIIMDQGPLPSGWSTPPSL